MLSRITRRSMAAAAQLAEASSLRAGLSSSITCSIAPSISSGISSTISNKCSATAGRQAVRAAAWQVQPARSVAAGTGVGGSGEQQAAVFAKARRMAGPVGLVAGVFGSIVGVGGGVIIVPTIVSACKNIPQRVVSGTSLAAVVSTALASAYTYSSQGFVDLGAAALISPVAMLTAPLGARLTSRLDCSALRRILGYFLLAAAPLVPLKAYLLSDSGGSSSSAEEGQTAGSAASAAAGGSSSSSSQGSSQGSSSSMPAALAAAGAGADTLSDSHTLAKLSALLDGVSFPPPAKAALLMATGAVAGIASGLLGVGGGLIVTPILALTMPYAQATVLGTSLLSMIPPASAALLQHRRLGNVDLRMAAALAAGTAVGSVVGSQAAVQAPPGYLEAAFCVGMLFLGRKTLATAK